MATNRAESAARTLQSLLGAASPSIPEHIAIVVEPVEDELYVTLRVENGAEFSMAFHAGAKLAHLVKVVRAAAVAAWGVGV